LKLGDGGWEVGGGEGEGEGRLRSRTRVEHVLEDWRKGRGSDAERVSKVNLKRFVESFKGFVCTCQI
jgi:hypothetical protein